LRLNQDGSPTWSRWSEAMRVITHPPFLKQTTSTALVVGLLLFLINHLEEVLSGQVGTATLVKGTLSCLVPFGVANWGLLTATRRKDFPAAQAKPPSRHG